MSFDESINKILQEAYFSSPYEKATGIKKQAITEIFDDETVDFDYDAIEFDDVDDSLTPEQEHDKFMDEGDAFVQKIQGLSELQGAKLRTQFGLHDITAQALDKWIDAGSPEGKPGVDLLINSFLKATSGVRLAGDETMTYELQKVAYALAFVTGLKNEKLIEAEKAAVAAYVKTSGIKMRPEEIFERRWEYHFDLDPATGHPKKLSREDKAAGITTKRQGKPLMSGERFRKILEGAQLKTKKNVGVQKPKDQADIVDPNSEEFAAAKERLAAAMQVSRAKKTFR